MSRAEQDVGFVGLPTPRRYTVQTGDPAGPGQREWLNLTFAQALAKVRELRGRRNLEVWVVNPEEQDDQHDGLSEGERAEVDEARRAPHPVHCLSVSVPVGKSGKRRELRPTPMPSACDCATRERCLRADCLNAIQPGGMLCKQHGGPVVVGGAQ